MQFLFQMVQRLTYRRRLSYNTRSNRKRMWVRVYALTITCSFCFGIFLYFCNINRFQHSFSLDAICSSKTPGKFVFNSSFDIKHWYDTIITLMQTVQLCSNKSKLLLWKLVSLLEKATGSTKFSFCFTSALFNLHEILIFPERLLVGIRNLPLISCYEFAKSNSSFYFESIGCNFRLCISFVLTATLMLVHNKHVS